MKIIKDISSELSKSCLILGFFDGVHIGHKEVILTAVQYAKKNNLKTVLLTFKNSPAECFGYEYKYISSRENTYKKIEELGVDFLKEEDFSEIVNISAEDFLQNNLIKTYSPSVIVSGFNYTYGKDKSGKAYMLEEKQQTYGYKYILTAPVEKSDNIISSTLIKKLLKNGDIKTANDYLGRPFEIESMVIRGKKIGRTLGFPTANMKYPIDIVRIPYGVYAAEVFGKKAVLNWGIKPTVDGNEEILETFITNFDGDLYDKKLDIKIIEKIRDEQKFESLEALTIQIKKDIEVCLKL